MATDDQVKQRLMEWGAWFASGGGAVVGFPRKNILHPSWMPPAGGRLPEAMASVANYGREIAVHRAIGQLSDKLIVAVVGEYAKRMTCAHMALELCCTSSAIEGRLARAHDRLRAILMPD